MFSPYFAPLRQPFYIAVFLIAAFHIEAFHIEPFSIVTREVFREAGNCSGIATRATYTLGELLV